MMFDLSHDVNCSFEAILHEENDRTDALLYLLFFERSLWLIESI